MSCDTDAFLADIEVCHGTAVIGGAEACPAVEDAVRLARIEGLEGHARAAEHRLGGDEPAAKKAKK